MSYIDSFAEFIASENRKASSKAIIIFITIVILFLADQQFGFSFHYKMDRNLDEIEKMDLILRDPSIDSTTKKYVDGLRLDLINRQNIYYYLSFPFRSTTLANSKIEHSKPVVNTANSNESPIRNNFIFLISAGGAYVLIGLIVFPILFFFVDKKYSFASRIGGAVTVLIIFCALCLVNSWIFSFIPQLVKSSWSYNYGLNTVLQVIQLAILGVIGNRRNKTTRQVP